MQPLWILAAVATVLGGGLLWAHLRIKKLGALRAPPDRRSLFERVEAGDSSQALMEAAADVRARNIGLHRAADTTTCPNCGEESFEGHRTQIRTLAGALPVSEWALSGSCSRCERRWDQFLYEMPG